MSQQNKKLIGRLIETPENEGHIPVVPSYIAIAHMNELAREPIETELLLRLIEAYRSGYSCGYADAQSGQRLRDKDAACAFYQIDGVPDITAPEPPSTLQNVDSTK